MSDQSPSAGSVQGLKGLYVDAHPRVRGNLETLHNPTLSAISAGQGHLAPGIGKGKRS